VTITGFGPSGIVTPPEPWALDVPACGHAAKDAVNTDRYDVRDAGGRFVYGVTGGCPGPIELVLVADDYPFAAPPASSEPLPPCEGVLEGQPGSEP
jgi:hypothetical protein